MSDKKQVGVKVDKRLWDEFRQDVRLRKGRTHGHLASELENAIENYLYSADGDDVLDIVKRIDERTARMENSPQMEADGEGGTLSREKDVAHTHSPDSGETNLPSVQNAPEESETQPEPRSDGVDGEGETPSSEKDVAHTHSEESRYPNESDGSPEDDTPEGDNIFHKGWPTGKKERKLLELVRSEFDTGMAKDEDIREFVAETTEFGDRSVKKYTKAVTNRLGAEPNPLYQKEDEDWTMLSWGKALEADKARHKEVLAEEEERRREEAKAKAEAEARSKETLYARGGDKTNLEDVVGGDEDDEHEAPDGGE